MNRKPAAPANGLPVTLAEALAGLEPALEAAQETALVRLFGLLQERQGTGITGFNSSEALARHYFREALELRRFLPGRGPYLDVGSGGGTPALPLAAVAEGAWTLLEPRRQAAGFLDLAADSLGIASRVQVVRARLHNYLNNPAQRSSLGAVAAVTLRAVRLRAQEWKGLAAALSHEAVVIWLTSESARARADLPSGVYDEEIFPAERGVVWLGRPRRMANGDDVSRETSTSRVGVSLDPS